MMYTLILLVLILLNPIISDDFISIKEVTNKDITFAKVNKIDDIKIKYNIQNFYMNDAISRSSETMALCTKNILNKAA